MQHLIFTSIQLGINPEDAQDSLFTSGMRDGAEGLGDNGVRQGDKFQPDWDSTFLQEIHGVTLITGDSHDSLNEKLASVKDILSGTVKEIATISGDVRPGDQKGHEQ